MNKKLITVAVAGVIGIGGFAQTAYAAGSGTANAKVAAAPTFTETTPMNYGAIDGAIGTVTINPGASPTYTNSGTVYSDAAHTQGVFSITTGEPSAAYTMAGDASVILTCTTAGTCGTSSATSTLTYVTASGAGTTGTLSGTGTDTVYVGGTLTISGSALPSGTYQGTYAIDITYN